VPYVRGRELSRRSGDIVAEVQRLTGSGFMEVMLLGQNVNSYRDPSSGLTFPMLLDEVAGIAGIKRIRFTTSHPKDLSAELISCYQRIGSLCSHIHLPLQSGSDRILELMNRRYTRSGYLEKICALRESRPDISVTTDIIVGFPGESAADFNDTLALMEEVKFDGAYSFKYSPRPGTKAAAMHDDVDEVEKARRLATLQELQREHTLSANKKSINRVEEVLAVGTSVRDLGEITGRSRTNKVVNFAGVHESIGSLVPVRILRANNNSLWGEAV
jgi:tRNA-2-methylthio-N6-dimethylallyladenosine synthase